jgi:hypothetical protein
MLLAGRTNRSLEISGTDCRNLIDFCLSHISLHRIVPRLLISNESQAERRLVGRIILKKNALD